MQIDSGRHHFATVAFVFALLGTLAAVPVGSQQAQQKGQQGVRATSSKAPDRDGSGKVEYRETGCPPTTAAGDKAVPDVTKGDADVSDDKVSPDSKGVVDYFMGEWKFVKGRKDLIVQLWCINRPGTATAYRDHFTYRILTSENGVVTVAVRADDEKT